MVAQVSVVFGVGCCLDLNIRGLCGGVQEQATFRSAWYFYLPGSLYFLDGCSENTRWYFHHGVSAHRVHQVFYIMFFSVLKDYECKENMCWTLAETFVSSPCRTPLHKDRLKQRPLFSLPVTASVEVELCRPTASVTTVMVYKVPGCRPSSSTEVMLLFRVTFFRRTLSWAISRTLKFSTRPELNHQDTLRLCEDEDATCRSSTGEGAVGVRLGCYKGVVEVWGVPGPAL